MRKVPIYSYTNYKEIISKPYGQQDTTKRITFKEFIQKYMTKDFVEKNKTLDARNLGDAGKDAKLVSCKLLMPTLRCCNYFFRDGKGTHHGVDIILPKGTPLVSFSSGIVHKVKVRDGQKKDAGNTVVIKSADAYWSYCHCDTVSVKVGDQITLGQTIATCGSTGNSTQFHLHLQVDNLKTKSQPYYDSKLNSKTIAENTINPMSKLYQLYVV